jgi:hypothetical protein
MGKKKTAIKAVFIIDNNKIYQGAPGTQKGVLLLTE